MPWTNSGVAKPIPQDLASLVAAAGTAVSVLTPLLTSLRALLTTAQAFIIGTASPYATIGQAIQTECQNFINDFFATGVYALGVDGRTISGVVKYDSLGVPLLTPGGAIAAAMSSLDDLGDFNRPQFSADANIAGIGFLASAPNIDEFITVINNMLNVLHIPDWNLTLNFIKRRRVIVTKSVPPDWKSVKLNSIQEMKDMQDAVLDLLGLVKGYTVVPDTNLADLANIISQKIAALNAISSRLQQLVSDLVSTTGIYVMNMPIGVGGNARLKTYLHDCPLERSTNQYTVMALFVGGGDSLQAVDRIRQLVV